MADLPKRFVSTAPRTHAVDVDPITLRVIGGAFDAIARRWRESCPHEYSRLRGRGFGAGLFDPDGRELCESSRPDAHRLAPLVIRGSSRANEEELKEGK